MGRPGGDETAGGEHLLEFVTAELSREDSRRTSLEARGLSISSVAGGIVALLVALRGFTGTTLSLWHAGARVPLIAGMACFVAAAFVAALTNAPRRIPLVDPPELLKLAPELWEKPADGVNRMIFASQLAYLEQAQRGNDRRGRFLFAGTVLLTLAILFLAITLSIAAA